MFKYRENQARLIREKPFIFLESKTDITKEAYIEWAAFQMKKNNKEVHVFDVPLAYKFDLLDKFKDKILTTGYQANPNGGTNLFSIFQLQRYIHAVATYHFDVEDLRKDFLSLVLITSKTSDFIDFVSDNQDVEESFQRASGGFNIK